MHRLAAPLVGMLLLLTACGSDGDEAEGDPALTPESTAAAPAETLPAGTAATAGNTVTVHYTGTLDDGSQFDTSLDGEPLEFTIGSGQVIDGFDAAVTGLMPGDTVTVRIPPEDAYGDYDAELLQDVPLDQLPEGVAAGDQLVSPQGAVVVVMEVDADSALIDLNHRLAGEALTFEITLVSISP